MSEFTELTISNFDQVHETHLAAIARDRCVLQQLHDRRGVNPTLDSILGDEEDFTHNLAVDISNGLRQAAVMRTANSILGLVVITHGVEVKKSVYGRPLIKGTCVEAVSTSKDKDNLAELYRHGVDMALDSNKRTNVFAIEKQQPPKVTKNPKRLLEVNPRDPQALRFAIGSVLPFLDSADFFVRSDNLAPKKQLTEVMSLKLAR